MSTCAVLWTNHHQATIVSTTNGVEEIVHVESKAKGGVEEKWRQHRGKYYRKVIRAMQGAREVFIFGPAQAKMELKIEILKLGLLSHRIVGSETADTMTESQLVARARETCRSRVV